MQYQVPQFIEVEDKIFGPLTFKQFVYLVGGGAMCFLLYRFLPKLISLLIIIPVASLSVALAFYKVNNKPFINVIVSAVKFFSGNKLYIWKKQPKKIEKAEAEGKIPKVFVPKLSASKLRELTWNLDIHENMQKHPVNSFENQQKVDLNSFIN